MQSYAFNLQNETIKRKTKDNMKEDKDNRDRQKNVL